jgi:hypothetical protein
LWVSNHVSILVFSRCVIFLLCWGIGFCFL